MIDIELATSITTFYWNLNNDAHNEIYIINQRKWKTRVKKTVCDMFNIFSLWIMLLTNSLKGRNQNTRKTKRQSVAKI